MSKNNAKNKKRKHEKEIPMPDPSRAGDPPTADFRNIIKKGWGWAWKWSTPNEDEL